MNISTKPNLFISSPIQNIGKALYNKWFQINDVAGTFLRKHSLITAAALHGMFSLESLTLAKVTWKTLVTYSKKPKTYGLNQIPKNSNQNPVLLIHGAAGTWNYMGDLAKSLSSQGIPVFVIDLGGGPASNEKRKAVHKKIKAIQKLYEKAGKTIPKVDIVAHSLGGSLAYASAFKKSCSTIDSSGNLSFLNNKVPEAKTRIRKIITLALPTDQTEINHIKTIGKLNDLYNITAKYDLLVGHKPCALKTELKEHETEINTTHVEIVYNQEAQNTLIKYLK